MMMNNCKEIQLDDVLAVVALPLANISASDVSSPVNTLTPTIPAFTPSYANAIAIGLKAPAADVTLIPIERKTGKAKDDVGDSVSGRLHTVQVTCEVDDSEASVWTALYVLERTPRHLLLTFRGGSRAFVAATEDTYQCTVERDGAKTTVSLKIQNLMGMQLMV
jgi:hypothetical protein